MKFSRDIHAEPRAPEVASTPGKQNYKVLLAGATGLVGGEILRLLADDPTVTEIRALTRRPLPPTLPAGVQQCLVDFDCLDKHVQLFDVDWVICALGTTMKKAGSRQAFRVIDFDYPLKIAQMGFARGARNLLLVSALGANANSHFFYNRVKGDLEETAGALGYRSLTIARPSLLLGKRNDGRRRGEEWAKRVSWLMPRPLRAVQASTVARALLESAHAERPGKHILTNATLVAYE